MLERLQIRNFRSFRDLEMPRMSRINLIAGGNNSGKTSVLEALFLLSGAGDPRMALHGNILRTAGDAEQARMTQEAVVETLWKPLFYRLDAGNDIEITADHKPSGFLVLKIGLRTRDTVELTLNDAGRVDLTPTEQQLAFWFRQGEEDPVTNAAHLGVNEVEFKGQQHRSVEQRAHKDRVRHATPR